MATTRGIVTRVYSLKLVFEDGAGPRRLLGTVKNAFPEADVKNKSSARFSLFDITVDFGDDKRTWPKVSQVNEKLDEIRATTDIEYAQTIFQQKVDLPGYAL